jgi:hypothetical protein
MNYDKINAVKEFAKSLGLSYQEYAVLGYSFFDYDDGVNYMHNYGFREIVVCNHMGLKRLKGLHGKDTDSNELKSVIYKRRKDGTFHITKKTSLGQFGRSDKDNVNENQDIICSVFDKDQVCIFSIQITNNENYKSFKSGKKDIKRNEMKDFKNVRDTTSITWGDILDNKLEYTIHFWNDEMKNVKFD